jgi:crotonobetainyl-CoA:carnitine CoA-transferase CaiB-like acyl-CoA transferase
VLRDVPSDEQAIANGSIVQSKVDEMPRTITAPIRMSFAPKPVDAGPGPRFGEHTDQVRGELGYSATDIKRLREAKAVA